MQKFFPMHRFYLLSYEDHAVPGKEREVAIAIGLYVTLGLGPEGKLHWFHGSGNYEEFGLFLAAQKITIKSREDAIAVWRAYCEIHRRGLKEARVEHPAETTWYLGCTDADKMTWFYEVKTDAAGVVLTGVAGIRPR